MITDSPLTGDCRILYGIPESLIPEAVALYWQAFGPKLGRVMGPKPRAHAYLTRVMRRSNALAVVDGAGRLVAIGGFRTDEGSFAGGSPDDLRAVYGRSGAAWRINLLGRVARAGAHHDDSDSFLIDGICVRADMRNRGIGFALIRALIAEGRRRGHSAIRLEVVEGNRAARSLYESLGFVAVETHGIGILRHVFGFASATTMICPLTHR